MKKLKKMNIKGFTLVELLCSVVIVILLTQCLTMGIGVGTKAFGDTYSYSKAQTLCSTLNFLLADEMRTATEIEPEEDGRIKYRSGTYGLDAKIEIDDDDQLRVRLLDPDKKDDYNSDGRIYKLGASSLYGDNLIVKEETFKIEHLKDRGVIKISFEIIDKTDKDKNVLASSEFEVKCFDPKST